MQPVTLYALSTCPWCAKAKAYFRDHRVQPFVIDYDLAGEDVQAMIWREMQEHDATGFPYVVIGETVVVGFDPQRYGELLGLS